MPEADDWRLTGQERFLAVVNLGDRRQHPRGDARGAARGVGIDDRDLDAALGRAPRHTQTDRTSANNNCVHGTILAALTAFYFGVIRRPPSMRTVSPFITEFSHS